HFERAAAFTSWAVTERAKRSGLLPWMGSIGDCLENAVGESFWARVEVELLNRRQWRTRVELANAIFEHLEIFHNRQRRHSSLGCTPDRVREDARIPVGSGMKSKEGTPRNPGNIEVSTKPGQAHARRYAASTAPHMSNSR